MSVVRPVVIA